MGEHLTPSGRGAARTPFHALAKAVMILAAALMTVVAFAAPSAAQTTATPSFVSPSPNGLLGGDSVVVTMDLAGLDIESSWMWAGSEPLAPDYSATHMGSSSSALITGLPTDGSPVTFTYFYLEVDSTWKVMHELFETTPAPFMLSPEIEGQVFDGLFDLEILGVHPLVETSWVTVGTSPRASNVAAQHMGTSDSALVSFFLPEVAIVWVTYWYRVDGRWYTIENMVQSIPPIT